MNVGTLAAENLQKYGEYECLHFEGRTITNVQRYRRAGAIASVLRDQGVVPGDVVIVMMANSPDVTSLFIACWALGAVICPITPLLTAREVAYMIADANPRAIVTSSELAERVGEAIAIAGGGPRRFLVMGRTEIAGAINIGPWVAEAPPVEGLLDRADDDLALVLYTSGTTGNPKGVMLSHYNLLSNARAVSQLSDDVPGAHGLSVLPLSHVFGIMLMNVGAIRGSRGVLLSRWDTVKVFEAIQEYRVERMAVVPTMLTLMLHHPDRERYDLSSLARVGAGGSALPEQLRVEFARTFRCRVKQGYGLSEATTTVSGYHDDWEYRSGSVGKAIPGVTIAILDDQDTPLAARRTGEICVRSPGLMRGYLNKPEATAEALRGGWLRTGDIGYLDEDGFLFITDRKKELVIKGGENISPREIEEVLYRHDAIAEAAVVGISDPVYGEELCAVVVAKPAHTVSEDEVKSHVGRFLTKFKIPGRVVFMDALPKNATGKIQKRAIADLVAR